jgi:hypothetical protein
LSGDACKEGKGEEGTGEGQGGKEARKEGCEEAGGSETEGRSNGEACRRGSYRLKPEPSSNNPLFHLEPASPLAGRFRSYCLDLTAILIDAVM